LRVINQRRRVRRILTDPQLVLHRDEKNVERVAEEVARIVVRNRLAVVGEGIVELRLRVRGIPGDQASGPPLSQSVFTRLFCGSEISKVITPSASRPTLRSWP